MLKKIFILILFFFLPASVFAVGGLKESEIICDPDAYPGVGLLRSKVDGSCNYGTAQLLPHSNGLLAITAKHCVEDYEHARISIQFGKRRIKVVEVFPHRFEKNDIALLRLEKSPGITDDLLPQFPNMSFLEKRYDQGHLTVGMEGTVVGFGDISKDDYHPALLFENEEHKKTAGTVKFPPEVKYFTEREISTLPWHFSESGAPTHTVFAGNGDSGGPLIVDGILAGIIVTSHNNLEEQLYDRLSFIDTKREAEIKSQNIEPTSTTLIYGTTFVIYVISTEDDFTIEVALRPEMSANEIDIRKAKKLFSEHLTLGEPWDAVNSPQLMTQILNCVKNCSIFEDAALTDGYLNVYLSMNFIKNVYERCGFDTSFMKDVVFRNYSNLSTNAIYMMATRAAKKYLQTLDKTTGLVRFFADLQNHIEHYISAKRAKGRHVNEFTLLEHQPFTPHVKQFLKAHENFQDHQAGVRSLELKKTALLPSLEKFTELKSLSITKSSLTSASAFSMLKTLTKLDLSHTLITTLEDIQELSNLTELKLNHTPISNLEGIKKLKQLRKLSLKHTQLRHLGHLVGLKNVTIDLRGNPQLNDDYNINLLKFDGCYILQD